MYDIYIYSSASSSETFWFHHVSHAAKRQASDVEWKTCKMRGQKPIALRSPVKPWLGGEDQALPFCVFLGHISISGCFALEKWLAGARRQCSLRSKLAWVFDIWYVNIKKTELNTHTHIYIYNIFVCICVCAVYMTYVYSDVYLVAWSPWLKLLRSFPNRHCGGHFRLVVVLDPDPTLRWHSDESVCIGRL